MATYRLKRVFPVESLKDFDQEDIYRFCKYRGRELYDKCLFTSLPRGGNLNDTVRGKFSPIKVSSFLKGSGVKIIFPANEREYSSNDYVYIPGPSEKFVKDYDLILNITKSGYIVFPEVPLWACTAFILAKYWTNSSTWNYRIFKNNKGYSIPVLSCPTKEKDWIEILKALTEIAVLLRLFVGDWFKLFLKKTEVEYPQEKYFSNINPLLSFIPTIINLGYSFIAYPKIMGRLAQKLSEQTLNNRLDYQEKLLKYVKNKYKDVYFVNLGTGSCFINPQCIKDVKLLKEHADSSRCRTVLDWLLKAYEDKKYLILYSDLDNSLALAHEVGHYLEDKDGTLGKIQRNCQKGLFSDKFLIFLGLMTGMISSVARGHDSSTAMISEILTTATGILLKSPQLIAEYMASYKGLDVLRDAGFSEKEVKEAREFFKIAYQTYLASNTAKASMSAGTGRVIGSTISILNKNYSETVDTLKVRSRKLFDKLKPKVKKLGNNLSNSINESMSNLKTGGRNNYVTYVD